MRQCLPRSRVKRLVWHVPALSVVSRQSRSRMALRNLIRNYRSRFISKNGSTRGLRLCLRSSVLTQKQDGQHERAAALPAILCADPNMRAALRGLRRCLRTPMPTQGTNRPPWGAAALPANLHAGPQNKQKGRRPWRGCGIACEPRCRPCARRHAHIQKCKLFYEPQRRRSRGQLLTLEEPALLAGQLGFSACLAFLVLVSWVLFCFVSARVLCLSGRGLRSLMCLPLRHSHMVVAPYGVLCV